MNEFNDDLSLLGDWMLPSPSPRFSFSSIIGDEGTSTVQESANGNNKCVAAGGDNNAPGNAPQVNQCQGNSVMNATSSSNGVSDDQHKSISRGGLMERMALRAGFNAPRLDTGSIKPTDPSKNPQVRSPYLTIPPGLSPTCLLESPVFLSNSLVQPSPTTGKFSFTLNGNNQNSSLTTDNQNKGKEKVLEDSSSFAFRHVSENGSIPNHDAASKLDVYQSKAEETIPGNFTSFAFRLDSESGSLPQFIMPNIAPSSGFPSSGVSFPLANSHLPQNVQPQNPHSQYNLPFEQANASIQHVQYNQTSNFSSEQNQNSIAVPDNNSSPFDELNEDDGDQRSGGTNIGGSPGEDGYNWRKYGQKQVKGSEHPRGYYKCTHLDCPVKKKVERSPQGRITEIIYKGAHNHPKPEPNRRLSIGGPGDTQLESEQPGTGADNGGMQENHEVLSSSLPLGQDGNNGIHNVYQLENGIMGSTSFSNDEDDEDRATRGSVSLGHDAVEDESESKRRRVESYTAAEMTGAMRAIREPRVVVQTTSDVDILDDGYRWRKYGQKVVKGNPNPRSYYKCTSPGCNVRKHVERASHDLKSVITTYEGKHNHDVPAARNATHGNNSGIQNSLANQQAPDIPSHHIHRPEPSQMQTNSARFDHAPMGSFGGLPGFPPMGAGPRMGFGMNQAGLAGQGLGGLRQQNYANLRMLSVNRNNPFFGHQPGLMSGNMRMPKPEPKPEPVIENGGLNTSNVGGGGSSSSSLYQQFVNSRLPLGPQM